MSEPIDPQLLSRLLRYDPETGKLFWLPRTPETFLGGNHPFSGGKGAVCRRWNSRFAKKEAFTSVCGNGYRQGHILGRKYLAHRVIWALVHHVWPIEIDHIDGDRANNRLNNLRAVTRAENNLNMARRRKNHSGTTGVRWTKGAWQADIRIDGNRTYLGRFASKQEAIAARKEAEKVHGFHPNHGRAA